MTGYSVAIKDSSKELNPKEKVMLKDVSDAIKLDEATKDGPLTLTIEAWVQLAIHNEKSDNKDYDNYVLIAKDGTKFVTGSESFWSSFMDIFSDMAGYDGEWAIKCYRLPSKNYKGKEFLTCSLI